MTDEPSRRHPRILIRKNTPAETRENWQFIKRVGGSHIRFVLRVAVLLLLIPAAWTFYALGYFDGATAVRNETISKESHNVR